MVRPVIIALATVFSINTVHSQVLSPPPLPEQARIADALKISIENKNLSKYASLLSDNIEVIKDGRRIADSKSAWLQIFGEKLTAEGVVFKVSSGYQSTGRILLIEYFNSAASWGSKTPSECCWSYDANAYDIRDGKIIKISKLTGGEAIKYNKN